MKLKNFFKILFLLRENGDFEVTKFEAKNKDGKSVIKFGPLDDPMWR